MESAAVKIRNPRTGVEDYSITPASAAEIRETCARLKNNQPAWASTDIAHRIDMLQALKQKISENKNQLTESLIADTGRRAISIIEVGGIIGLIDRWCKLAPVLLAEAQSGAHDTSIPGISYRTKLSALGLTGVISPWNFPLTLSMIDTIPALLAGCAVALKPSEVTPRFAAPMRACIDAVPELSNVFAIVDGAGETGQNLIDCVDAICFTGSVATGRKVGEQAARNFIPAFLELGGKDPAIVLASADVATSATALLRGSIVNSGQACQSIERIYVHRSIFDAFVDSLVKQAQAVHLNASDIRHGHIGPLIFSRQAEIISDQLANARAKGAIVHTGGTVETLHGGFYCKPTVLTHVSHDMKIMSEETFGPVLPVMPFDTVAEAVALANDSIYGLSGAVFAATAEEAESVAEHLNVGAVSINDAALTSMVWEAEKSSFKLSGLGASRMGSSGFLRFFRKQALIRQSGAPAPIQYFAEESLP
jgi:succinate-semialdehyde dehydrogenase / glutarate-semialdehyde dehydrogenase